MKIEKRTKTICTPDFGTKYSYISSENKHIVGLIAYVTSVVIKLYSNLVYSRTECHLDNADDPNVQQLNLIICFDFDDYKRKLVLLD